MIENQVHLSNSINKNNMKEQRSSVSSMENSREIDNSFHIFNHIDLIEKIQNSDYNNADFVSQMASCLKSWFEQFSEFSSEIIGPVFEVLLQLLQSQDLSQVIAGIQWIDAIFFPAHDNRDKVYEIIQPPIFQILSSYSDIDNPLYYEKLLALLLHFAKVNNGNIIKIFGTWPVEFFYFIIQNSPSPFTIAYSYKLLLHLNRSKFTLSNEDAEIGLQAVIHTITGNYPPQLIALAINFSQTIFQKMFGLSAELLYTKFNIIPAYVTLITQTQSSSIISETIGAFICYIKKHPNCDISMFNLPFLFSLFQNPFISNIQNKLILFMNECLNKKLSPETIKERVELFLSIDSFAEQIVQVLPNGSTKSKIFICEFLNTLISYSPVAFIGHLIELNLIELLLEALSIDDETCQLNIILVFYLIFKAMEESELMETYLAHLNETDFWECIEENLENKNTCIVEHCQNFINSYHQDS